METCALSNRYLAERIRHGPAPGTSRPMPPVVPCTLALPRDQNLAWLLIAMLSRTHITATHFRSTSIEHPPRGFSRPRDEKPFTTYETLAVRSFWSLPISGAALTRYSPVHPLIAPILRGKEAVHQHRQLDPFAGQQHHQLRAACRLDTTTNKPLYCAAPFL